MELILELYSLLEKETPGLQLGSFVLNPDAGTIFTKIGGKTYEFKPKEKNAAELHKSVVGMAKHSQGRALAYLKQHATGTPVKESLDIEDPIVEDLEDQTKYTNLNKFENAVAALAVKIKKGTWEITVMDGKHVYHRRNHYFAVWDPKKRFGIIDPDFKGKADEIIDQMEKSE